MRALLRCALLALLAPWPPAAAEPAAPGRSVRVAAVTGSLDWAYRRTYSHDRFAADVARRYIAGYTAANLDRMERACAAGARIVVGQEYFRGSELFLTTPDMRRNLVEPADGPTSRRLRELSKQYDAILCASYDCDHGTALNQTGIVSGADGSLVAVHPKHPRSIPAPDGWPFPTDPRVYPLPLATVGVLVCSDCTYDPGLPLAMAREGMEVLLLPGCGFMGDLWEHFVVVRARDAQCVVIYADDDRAAIVDATGKIVARTNKRNDVLIVDVTIVPKKNSPDGE
jgi:predicted amidohydrolase